MEALCADGVTTRDEVSTVSGRGVGMAAVRQRVRSMGGKMEVRSVRGVGTHWIIRFPWTSHDSTSRSSRPDSQVPSRAPLSLAAWRHRADG